MSECTHIWEMVNVRFGSIAFEKCFHCNGLRTYFMPEIDLATGDEYREGPHFWNRVENAQSFRFDLQCSECEKVETFSELMGLMHCTGCMPDCKVDILRRKLEVEKTWIVVAFGFLPQELNKPIVPEKLEILTEYFNQRRDTSRSKVAIVPFTMIDDLSRCFGDFIHDVGMLSKEPVEDRKHLF